jgi:hypothetical protein
MIDIEPFYKWREQFYISEEDSNSPFYNKTYSDFTTENTVYNYYIHPQWDYFGSETLYAKIIFADYDKGEAILEFIGEWNDAITNDIMHLKRNVIEPLIDNGISKFVLIMENVLNFHGSDDDYYAEWAEEAQDSFNGGWIAFLNTYDHVSQEMKYSHLDQYSYFGMAYNGLVWRQHSPHNVVKAVEMLVKGGDRRIMQ